MASSRGRLLALALVLAGCRTSGRASLTSDLPPPFPADVQRGSDGLTIATEVDRAVPAVAIVSVVAAGTAQDPPGQEGLAHLVEHLAHRRRAVDGSTWRRQVLATGAEWQGSTAAAETLYYVLVPTPAAGPALEREAERLADPLGGVDEDVFARELRLVQDERRLRSHRPQPWHLLHCIEASLYPGSPEHAGRDETEQSLARLTLADAERFADQHYRPARTMILLAGDLPTGAAAAFSGSYRQAAAALPAAPPPASPDPAPPPGPCVPVAPWQYEVWVAWKVPPFDRHSASVQLMAEAWVRRQAESLLSERHLGLQSVDVVLSSARAGGVLAVKAVFPFSFEAPAVGRLVAKEIRQRVSVPVASGNLEETRYELALEQATAFEDLSRRALMTADWMVRTGTGPGDLLRANRRALETSTYDELDRFIARHLQAKQGSVWLATPAEDPPPLSAQAIDQLVSRPDPTVWTAAAPRPAARPAGATSDQAGIRRFRHQTRQRRLDNGLTVLAVHRPGSATASAAVGFRSGHAHGPTGLGMAAQHAHRSPWREAGLETNMEISATMTIASVQGLAGDLPRALDWLAGEVSTNREGWFTLGPIWPPDNLESQIVPYLTSRERRMETRLAQAFTSAVYDGHRYGYKRPVEQLREVSRDQVYGWLGGARQPANGLLVVVSGEDPARVLERASAEFGSWEPSAPPLAAPPPLPHLREAGSAPEPAPVYVPVPASDHARLTLGCRLPATSLREAARAHLLIQLMEADFWSEVREAHGDSYGFGVQSADERDSTVVALGAEIPVELLAKVLARLRQRWNGWAAQGFDPEQLSVVRAGTAASTWLEDRTAASLARHLAEWWALGRSLEDLDRWPDTLASLDQDELHETARLCRANLVLGLAADKGLAEAAVKAGWKD